MKWSKERLQNINIAPLEGAYEAIPETPNQFDFREKHPELFKFRGLSLGDNDGQLCIIPLDDADKETAEYVLRAIRAYEGG